MRIKPFVIGMVSTNCYVVMNETTKEAVIVDLARHPKKILDYIEEKELDVKAILLTHGHFDHIMGIDALLEVYDIPVYVHEGDKETMNNPALNLSGNYSFSDAVYLKDGDVLKIAGMEFKVIHTPGHTPGCACYYAEEDKILFSGDTLFEMSVGRTDFPNSSTKDLVRSVREKLFTLPDDVLVFPGHMGDTSIGYEKLHNMYV